MDGNSRWSVSLDCLGVTLAATATENQQDTQTDDLDNASSNSGTGGTVGSPGKSNDPRAWEAGYRVVKSWACARYSVYEEFNGTCPVQSAMAAAKQWPVESDSVVEAVYQRQPRGKTGRQGVLPTLQGTKNNYPSLHSA